MGAASTDRLVAQRRGRKTKARWPAKYKRLKDDRDAECAAADAAMVSMEKLYAKAQWRLDVMYQNGPAVLEIVQMKQSGFFARLFWALRFAWTKTLRFERIHEES